MVAPSILWLIGVADGEFHLDCNVPLTSEYDSTQTLNGYVGINTNAAIVINKDSEYVEELCKMMDIMCFSFSDMFHSSFFSSLSPQRASLMAQLVKNLPAMRETWVQSLSWEDPLEGGSWQLTPVFLPGESHGQRCLAGYSPRGRKE